MDKLTQEQVEELLARCDKIIEGAMDRARQYFVDPKTRQRAEEEYADMCALLRLAQDQPSAELVKLGEAAVRYNQTLDSLTCPMSMVQRIAKEDAERAIFVTARAYARSVEERT